MAYTGKDVTRGLRTLYRTRAYSYITASAGLWIASVLVPPVVPFAAVASLLPVQAFAEEWRVSERMIYRQKKQELIRSNEGQYWLNPESGKPQITIIKKSYATANMAKQSYKNYMEGLWRESPELHPTHSMHPKHVKRPYAIPLYGKTHRFTVYTLSPTVAKEMFEKSCKLYKDLFGKPVSHAMTANETAQTKPTGTLNVSG